MVHGSRNGCNDLYEMLYIMEQYSAVLSHYVAFGFGLVLAFLPIYLIIGTGIDIFVFVWIPNIDNTFNLPIVLVLLLLETILLPIDCTLICYYVVISFELATIGHESAVGDVVIVHTICIGIPIIVGGVYM